MDGVVWLTPFQTQQNLAEEIKLCGGLYNLEICGIETLSSSDRTYLRLRDKLVNGSYFLVVDESFKIKNNGAKRTQRILELSRLCEYKLVLNGTPITRNLLDIWSQFEFLCPKILNMSLQEFKSNFCEIIKVTKRHNGRVSKREFISDYHNIDYLYSLICHYVYECDLQLSVSQQHEEHKYRLSETDMEQYQYLKSKYLDNEKLQFVNNNIFIEMTQKMQHIYSSTEDKFVILENIIKNHDPSTILIYTKYISSGADVRQRFPDIKVLTYGKHSYGLNLQQYHTTIYFDKTFDYSQMLQSQFRTYRTGQNYNCTYIHLTGNVGLEKMITDNINKKQSLLDYFKKVGVEQIKKEL